LPSATASCSPSRLNGRSQPSQRHESWDIRRSATTTTSFRWSRWRPRSADPREAKSNGKYRQRELATIDIHGFLRCFGSEIVGQSGEKQSCMKGLAVAPLIQSWVGPRSMPSD
jgi:hypothetical protein